MLHRVLIILCLFLALASSAQNESQKNIDYRMEFSKSFFEEWHKKSEFTPLSNDTLIAIQEIIDILQPYPYENRNEASDHVEIYTKLDENGIPLSEEQVLQECNLLSNPVTEIADSLKYYFYDSRLSIQLLDSLNQARSVWFKDIIFKPRLKGKILFIDHENSSIFNRIVLAIREDNPNALGKVENLIGVWYAHYHLNAPFNRHMQELISSKCLNYAYDDGELAPIDPVQTITLTKDLNEAIVFQKPYEYSPQIVRLKKTCGKWEILE